MEVFPITKGEDTLCEECYEEEPDTRANTSKSRLVTSSRRSCQRLWSRWVICSPKSGRRRKTSRRSSPRKSCLLRRHWSEERGNSKFMHHNRQRRILRRYLVQT